MNPFQPGVSTNPFLAPESYQTIGPKTEEEKLMEYIKAQSAAPQGMGTEMAMEKAVSPGAPEMPVGEKAASDVAGKATDSKLAGNLVGAGLETLGNIGGQIAKSKGEKEAARMRAEGMAGSMRQAALQEQQALAGRALSQLMASYRR